MTRKKARELTGKRIDATPGLIDKSRGVTLVLQYTEAGGFIKTVYHKLKRHREQRSYNVFRGLHKQYRQHHRYLQAPLIRRDSQMAIGNMSSRKSSAPWNGFVSVILGKETNHTRTVRYGGTFEFPRGRRTFTYYAPRPHLRMAVNSEQKTAIVVHIFPSHLQGNEAGSLTSPNPPSVNRDAWEFQLTNRRLYHPVNSWLYDTWHENRRYNIYVPKLFMGTDSPPRRILVDISNVPAE